MLDEVVCVVVYVYRVVSVKFSGGSGWSEVTAEDVVVSIGDFALDASCCVASASRVDNGAAV